jgi:hypothetical protein
MGTLRLGGFYLQLQSPRAVDTINYITTGSGYAVSSLIGQLLRDLCALFII